MKLVLNLSENLWQIVYSILIISVDELIFGLLYSVHYMEVQLDIHNKLNKGVTTWYSWLDSFKIVVILKLH